jgi:hypothetical protein
VLTVYDEEVERIMGESLLGRRGSWNSTLFTDLVSLP